MTSGNTFDVHYHKQFFKHLEHNHKKEDTEGEGTANKSQIKSDRERSKLLIYGPFQSKYILISEI